VVVTDDVEESGMKVVTLAAGVAVGYVLGTRAGREKYEQIVSTVRNLNTQPGVVQAKDKARALAGTGTEAVTAKLAEKSQAAQQTTVTPPVQKTEPTTVSTTVTPERPDTLETLETQETGDLGKVTPVVPRPPRRKPAVTTTDSETVPLV